MIKRRPAKKEIEYVLSWKLAMVVTKNSERILIGPLDQIKRRLEGQEDAELYFDRTRPFGTLLLTLDEYPAGDWRTAISRLYEAQELMHSLKLDRPSAKVPEDEAEDILHQKYASEDPICQFVAARIWCGYWAYREKKSPASCIQHLDSMQNLIRPLGYPRYYTQELVRITDRNPIFWHAREFYDCDREMHIYQIDSMSEQDCIIIDASLIPLENYYLSKFEKWKKYMIRCRVCNRLFIADSLKFELCSHECKKRARADRLVERNQNEETSEIDRICTNASAHWYNRLKSMKKSTEYTQEDIQTYTHAKNLFLEEKKKKRQEHKKGKISYAELQEWLLQQENKAQAVLESIQPQRDKDSPSYHL